MKAQSCDRRPPGRLGCSEPHGNLLAVSRVSGKARAGEIPRKMWGQHGLLFVERILSFLWIYIHFQSHIYKSQVDFYYSDFIVGFFYLLCVLVFFSFLKLSFNFENKLSGDKPKETISQGCEPSENDAFRERETREGGSCVRREAAFCPFSPSFPCASNSEFS